MAILKEKAVWRRARPAGPRYSTSLTPDEQANVMRALAVLRIRFGTWAKVAIATGMAEKTIGNVTQKRNKPSPGLAMKVARAAGVALEDVLSGVWPKAGSCPMCGQRVSQRRQIAP